MGSKGLVILYTQVRTEHGLRIVPDISIADCPPLDILVIPGGKSLSIESVNLSSQCFIRHAILSSRLTYMNGPCLCPLSSSGPGQNDLMVSKQ